MQIQLVVAMCALNPLNANHVIIVLLHLVHIALLAFIDIFMLLVPQNVNHRATITNTKTHGIIVVAIVMLLVQPVMDPRITLAFRVLA